MWALKGGALLDIKSLYTLVAVSDFGSFGAAAGALGLSVSAVSLQIRALEEETDLLLFDRSSRPPALTAEGGDLVYRARGLLDHWESLNVSLQRDPARGVLRIGAVHTSVAGAVPDALRRLRDARPELNIRLLTGLTEDVLDRVRSGVLDCGIITEPDRLSDDLRFTAFAEEPLVVIAHRSVIGESDEDILRTNPYVRFSRHALFARLVDQELRRRELTVQSRMEIDMLDAVISLVVASLGVSIVPDKAGGRPFPAEIRSVPFGNPPIMRRLGVLMRVDCSRAHLVSLLLDEVRAAYGETVSIANPARPGLKM